MSGNRQVRGGRNSGISNTTLRPGYDPSQVELHRLSMGANGNIRPNFSPGFQRSVPPSSPSLFNRSVLPPARRNSVSATSSAGITLESLYQMMQELQDEVVELKTENLSLKQSLNSHITRICVFVHFYTRVILLE